MLGIAMVTVLSAATALIAPAAHAGYPPGEPDPCNSGGIRRIHQPQCAPKPTLSRQRL